MKTRDYPALHVDTNSTKAAACSKKGYGCINKHERLSNITLRHKLD